jgi:hypothetical protein
VSGNEIEIKVSFHREPLPEAAVKADAHKLGDEAGKALTDGMAGAVDAEAPKLEKSLGDAGTAGGKKAHDGVAKEVGKDGEKIGEKLGEDLVQGVASGVDRAAPKLDEPLKRAGKRGGGKAGEHAGDEFIKSFPFGIGKGAIGLGKAIVTIIDKLAPTVAADAALLGEKAGKAVADGVIAGADTAAQDIPQLFTPQGAIGAAIIGGALATLAPLAASAIGIALSLGVGAAVVGAAVAVERNTPRVADAFGVLKDDIAAELKDDAWVLVEPFHDALAQIDIWAKNEGEQFSGIFAAAAPGVKGLTADVLGFVSAVMPGVRDITQMFSEFVSDPQTEATFERLGGAIGSVFSTIGRNKQTIEDTFTLLVDLIAIVTGMFNVLVWTARGFDEVIRGIAAPISWLLDKIGIGGDKANRTLTNVKDTTHMLVPVAHDAAASYDDLAGSLSKVTNTADTLAGALADKVFSTLVRGDLATLHFDESLTRLSGSFKENGKAISLHTEKGQANREAILASVQANIEQYDSMIAAGLSAKDAASAYDTNTRALEGQLRAAGLLPDQIQKIIGKYKNVPDNVNTTIVLKGLETAIEDLNTTLRLINGLDGKTATVTIQTRRVGGVTGTGTDVPSVDVPPSRTAPKSPLKHPTQTPNAHASGGVAGGWSTIDEYGPELVKLPTGAMVYPAGQSRQMAAQMAAPQQSGPSTLSFAGGLDQAFASLVMRMFRSGQIQLTAGGQRVQVG